MGRPSALQLGYLSFQFLDPFSTHPSLTASAFFPGLDDNANGSSRVLAQYDATTDQMDAIGTDTDGSGHGTHVTSLMLSSAVTAGGSTTALPPVP